MDHHQQQDDSASLLLTRNFFLLHVHGTVEGVAFPGEDYDHLRCKVLFRFGSDWALVGSGGNEQLQSKAKQQQSTSKQPTKHAKEHRSSSVTKQTPSAAAAPSVFLSQTAVRAEDGGSGQQQKLSQQSFVWNLPLEATFQSTNVFGWPQVVGKQQQQHYCNNRLNLDLQGDNNRRAAPCLVLLLMVNGRAVKRG